MKLKSRKKIIKYTIKKTIYVKNFVSLSINKYIFKLQKK